MESSQERNLPATERKLQKARTDGQAPRSRDLSHLAILGAGALALLALTPALLEHLLRGMGQQLAFDAQTVQSPASMLARLQSMAAVGLIASGVFSALTAAAALLAAVLAGGWIFSTKPIAPQFNRLNPLSGLANLFSKQQMVNVAKMVLLTGVLTGVAWKYLSGSIDEVAVLVLQPSSAALRHVADWLTQGLGLLLLVVFLAALVDVPLQALLFKNRLKMSHEEIKQEHKESEGSPQIKSRIRQRQREIADRASITAVPQADFVVMNPTHYAVALRYDDQAMNAPQVIAGIQDPRHRPEPRHPGAAIPGAGACALCPCRAGPAHSGAALHRRGPGAGLCVPPQGRAARPGSHARRPTRPLRSART